MYQNRLIDIQDTHNIDPEIELEDLLNEYLHGEPWTWNMLVWSKQA
jgi:hypothetical protein